MIGMIGIRVEIECLWGRSSQITSSRFIPERELSRPSSGDEAVDYCAGDRLDEL